MMPLPKSWPRRWAIERGAGDGGGFHRRPIDQRSGCRKGFRPSGRCAGQGRQNHRRRQGRSDDRFVRPVIIGDANPDMRLASEETFGPLAPLFRFTSERQAIEMANDTPFGLAAYFYTRDLSRSFRVAEALEAGMIALNTGGIAMEMAPFGGIKQSGLGREGGHQGIEEYLETKAFHIGGLELGHETHAQLQDRRHRRGRHWQGSHARGLARAGKGGEGLWLRARPSGA
jgi:hypothetical protein